MSIRKSETFGGNGLRPATIVVKERNSWKHGDDLQRTEATNSGRDFQQEYEDSRYQTPAFVVSFTGNPRRRSRSGELFDLNARINDLNLFEEELGKIFQSSESSESNSFEGSGGIECRKQLIEKLRVIVGGITNGPDPGQLPLAGDTLDFWDSLRRVVVRAKQAVLTGIVGMRLERRADDDPDTEMIEEKTAPEVASLIGEELRRVRSKGLFGSANQDPRRVFDLLM